MSKVASFIMTIVSSVMTMILLVVPLLIEFKASLFEVYYGAIAIGCGLFFLWLLTISEYMEA